MVSSTWWYAGILDVCMYKMLSGSIFVIDQELAYDLCLEVGAAWVLCAASLTMMTSFGRLLVYSSVLFFIER